MNRWMWIWCACLLSPLSAIPNAVLGAVHEEASPLDDQDLTDQMLAGVWKAGEKLPGTWREEGMVETASIEHLLARPKILGAKVTLVRSIKREDVLESIEITYADAGSFFGYFQADEQAPKNLTRKEQIAHIQQQMQQRQQEFAEQYASALDTVRSGLEAFTGEDRPKRVKIGKTRALRAEVDEWETKSGQVIRLWADGQRMIRVTVHASAAQAGDWIDASIRKLDARARAHLLAEKVTKAEDGTVSLSSIKPIPQGYQPYCGLNTLAMAARHFGLHVDEDWLAVAGKFQNTGSAAGSDILGLYSAVASEVNLRMDRQTRLSAADVRRSIDQGLPVIVWRRFSHERNQLHNQHMQRLKSDATATLPDPTDPQERASWPDRSAPLHASVIVGYHPQRGEFLFLESWTGKDQARRMRVQEMEATTYYAFVFEK